MEGGPSGLMGIAASLAAGRGNLLVQSPVIVTVLPGSVRGSVNNLVDARAIHGKKPLVPLEILIMCPFPSKSIDCVSKNLRLVEMSASDIVV